MWSFSALDTHVLISWIICAATYCVWSGGPNFYILLIAPGNPSYQLRWCHSPRDSGSVQSMTSDSTRREKLQLLLAALSVTTVTFISHPKSTTTASTTLHGTSEVFFSFTALHQYSVHMTANSYRHRTSVLLRSHTRGLPRIIHQSSVQCSHTISHFQLSYFNYIRHMTTSKFPYVAPYFTGVWQRDWKPITLTELNEVCWDRLHQFRC